MVMDLRRMRTFGNLITFEWKSKSNSMEKLPILRSSTELHLGGDNTDLAG